MDPTELQAEKIRQGNYLARVTRAARDNPSPATMELLWLLQELDSYLSLQLRATDIQERELAYHSAQGVTRELDFLKDTFPYLRGI
jgi:hypothetical protein